MKRKTEIEPYQPFFLSGLLISILGLTIWVLFYQGLLSFYPSEAHALLMVMGFLFAYINGFLMTAVPKMSQSDPASPKEIAMGLVLLWLQIPLSFLGFLQLNYILAFVQIVCLFYFFAGRFVKRRANPPKAFLFLPFALGAAALGSLILTFQASGLPGEWIYLGKNLLFQAFVLNLILGLGSRLVPALTRVQGAIDPRQAKKESGLSFVLPAVILNLSFFVDAFWSVGMGHVIKVLVIGWMAAKHLKIFTPLLVRGYLGLGIRAGVISLALGYLLAAVFPHYSLHFLHFSFIGGFSLITFLVSTRVVLAHGSYDLKIELNHAQIIWFSVLVLFTGTLRAVGGLSGSISKPLIWGLFACWLVMCAVWARSFGRKLLKMERSTS